LRGLGAQRQGFDLLFDGSEPGLRGELPVLCAEESLPGDFTLAVLERSDKN